MSAVKFKDTDAAERDGTVTIKCSADEAVLLTVILGRTCNEALLVPGLDGSTGLYRSMVKAVKKSGRTAKLRRAQALLADQVLRPKHGEPA